MDIIAIVQLIVVIVAYRADSILRDYISCSAPGYGERFIFYTNESLLIIIYQFWYIYNLAIYVAKGFLMFAFNNWEFSLCTVAFLMLRISVTVLSIDILKLHWWYCIFQIQLMLVYIAVFIRFIIHCSWRLIFCVTTVDLVMLPIVVYSTMVRLC